MSSPGHPVCRADHVGSLLRPAALRNAYREFSSGKIDDAQFRAAQDTAISEVVQRQESAGLGAVTDGEFRRRSWFAGFVDAVDGLTHKNTSFKFVEGDDANISVPVPHAEAIIHRSSGICTDEFDFMRDITERPVKITLPAPPVMHFFRGQEGINAEVYPDIEQFWSDLLAVYKQEIAALAKLGCTYLQLDEVPMALLCDPVIRERIADWGWDWQALLERYIAAVNGALESRPDNMTVAMHLCRGNFRGHWIGTGGYEPVAERLFQETEVDVFLLEFDSDRAGDFSPLRFVPSSKAVVLGLISSKSPELEAADAVGRRIDDASRFLSLDQLALSPQCGFGTTVGGAPMDEMQQFDKLELVGQVARQVWGSNK